MKLESRKKSQAAFDWLQILIIFREFVPVIAVFILPRTQNEIFRSISLLCCKSLIAGWEKIRISAVFLGFQATSFSVHFKRKSTISIFGV